MLTVLYPTVSMTTGGAEQQLLELVRSLDKRRFRPIVALLRRGGTREAELNDVPGVEVVYLDRRHKLDFSPLWKLIRLIHQRKVDVVQPFVSPALFFGLLAGLLTRAPVTIATERGGARRDPGLGGRLYLFASTRLLPYVSVAVANSEAGRTMLRGHGLPDSRTLVIRNGISPDRLNSSADRVAAHRQLLGASDESPVVGILATLKPAKGQDTFLRAAVQVAAQRPDSRFAIVGDGPLRADLEALADALGIRARVHFFGFQRNVADLLNAFDVLVSASRDNEGHSNSILEAMALGVPVIATDIGGSRELVEHRKTGLLISADDDQALATAILTLLNQPKRTRTRVAEARALVNDQFTLERMVSSYESLYLDCLGQRSSTTAQTGQRAPLGGVLAAAHLWSRLWR